MQLLLALLHILFGQKLQYRSMKFNFVKRARLECGASTCKASTCEASTYSRITLAIEDREAAFKSGDVVFQIRDVAFQTRVSSHFNSISGHGFRDQDN